MYQVWEVASKALKDEEAVKQKLCDDLSNLVPISNWLGAHNAMFHAVVLDTVVLDRSKKAAPLSSID